MTTHDWEPCTDQEIAQDEGVFFKGPLGKHWWNLEGVKCRDLLRWAATRSPGDIYNGCDFFNHKVDRIESWYCTVIEDDEFGPCMGTYKRKENLEGQINWVFLEVVFFNSDGTSHTCPGGGCASPPWDATQIRAEGLECDDLGLKIK